MNRQKASRNSFALALALAMGALALGVLPIAGCSVWENRPRLRKQEIKMDVSTAGVPPIRVEALDGRHMLIMQAPHSGWMIEMDKDERTPDGFRILVTVRRPDPSFLYPQAIVEKRLLTEIHGDARMDIYARVLNFDEEPKSQGYGRITPVEEFEE